MSWIKDETIQSKPNQLMNIFNPYIRESIQDEKKSLLPVHLFKNKGKKPSQIIYDEIYKEIVESGNAQRFCKRPALYELKDQNYKCWQCQGQISNGFLSIGANCDICLLNGRYFCSDCMSMVRMPIPWMAVEIYDLRHYKVSKLGQAEIEKIQELPILEIENSSKLVINNKSLFEFLILKRQIHLMYDMICDPKLVQSLLEKRMNLTLKRNLFSLKDLYEIYNGSLARVVQGYYIMLYKHIDLCKSCQKRGHICKICKSIVPIHAFDIKNVTYCEKCLKVYHRECLDREVCPYCIENK